MYDMEKHEYLSTYVISPGTVHKLQAFLDMFDVNYFMNLILDDMLIIQYKELKNPAEKDIYDKLHTSPYRNYTKENLLPKARCIYFMLIGKQDNIHQIADALQSSELLHTLRMVTYPSNDYPGYAYIKIYNENATRENMIAYLKKKIGVQRSVTFGSIEGRYDVVIREYDSNKVVKVLKKMYEPLRWSRKNTNGLNSLAK